MGSRNFLIYGGINSSDYGVYILDAKVNNSPKREYESIQIEGRSGDLHIDKKRFTNITVPYSCAIVENADFGFDHFIAALLAEGANKELSDTLHPVYFRRGTFSGEIEPRMDRRRSLAVFDLIFDCAPQKWLRIGQDPVTVSNSGTLINPTYYAAKPLIKVNGTGTISIGGETLTITSNTGNKMVIDCETEDVYNSDTLASMNDNITFSSGDFPALSPGNNGVTVSGVTVEITPRWWTI